MQVNSISVSLLFLLFPLSLALLFHFQNCSNISAKNLQQQLDVLEGDSVNLCAKAEEHEQTLTRCLEYCTTRDNINEVGWWGWAAALPKVALN